MSFLLSPWPPGYRHGNPPPLELLLPFLEQPAPNTAHVGWNGLDTAHPEADFREKTHEAVYFWPWSGVALAAQRYPVVRVLFWWLRNAREKRTSIANDCGVAACCNIDHWHVVSSAERAEKNRIVVYTAFESPTYRRKQ